MSEFNGPYFSRDLFGPDGRLTRLHKGAKQKDQTAQQLKLEKEQLNMLGMQMAEMERTRNMPTPEAPKALPAMSPPTEQTSADSQQAAMDARRKSLKRMAPGRSTIFAGETGRAGKQLGGPKTILG